MIKRILIGLGLALLVLALASILSRRLVLVLYHLPWGWISFLNRTLHDVTLNGSGIGMGILCSLVILALLHLFLSWLARQRRTQGADPSQVNPSGSRSWPWRWTLSLYAALWILFGIVIGASGLWRHGQWFASIDPLYSVRRNPHAELKIAEGKMAVALLEAKGHWPETRTAFQAEDSDLKNYGAPAWERFHMLYFPDTNGILKAVLIVPRDEQWRQQAGFALVTGKMSQGFLPITNLASVIARLEGTSPSPR